ncbi:hypothetical protein, partial [Myxococcus vastator]|uniref:hypothetical protein n=1 Tax=Myxococcus vastator TaxID=2709664 RepID=UPI001967B337
VDLKMEQFTSTLVWLATLMPYAESIEKAYDTGIIPADEIIFPTDIMSIASSELDFPLDPTRRIINRLHDLTRRKIIRNFPTILHAQYPQYSAGGVVSFALAFVNEGTILASGGCLIGSRPPIPEHDVSDALALVQLDKQLVEYEAGACTPLPPEAVITTMRRFAWAPEWEFTSEGKYPSFTFRHKPRKT